jgi:hypothetical protein
VIVISRWLVPYAIGVAVSGCGSRTALQDFTPDAAVDATVAPDAGPPDAEPDVRDAGVHEGGGVPTCMDAGPPSPDGGCVNLECRIATCDGGAHTTLRGRVYDPAGRLPLYDVLVYVPNRPLDPMPSGVTCGACQAPASGSPIRTAVTDPDGRFTLVDVPSGSNVPLVMQLGKWRRAITIPEVAPCAETVIDDPATTRLPARSSEGDMPLIALTTGCDPVECFLRRVGIDDSEFVPPGDPTGHVHVFTGYGLLEVAGWSMVDGGYPPASTYSWWRNAADLMPYDIVFDACECGRYDPNQFGSTGDAYRAIDAYLNAGGRVFATHYFGDWFAPPNASPDLQRPMQWAVPVLAVTEGIVSETDEVDQSFPRGQAFAAWLLDSQVSATPGAITLSGVRDDVIAPAPPGCSTAAGTCLSTSWLNHPGDGHPRYLSFNTPVGNPPDQQCGRAVFSDVHLAGTSNAALFPTECATADPGGVYAPNESAFEFLFFDLSSCVQDDSKPPRQPCQQ